MKLKKINWTKQDNILIAKVLGYTLSVVQNNGKWDSRLVADNIRPEIQSGFDTSKEAIRYAEQILLHREITKWFEDDKWVSVKARLPKENDTVMVYDSIGNKKNRIYTARLVGDRFLSFVGFHETVKVTYWKPLPKAPE